MSRLKEKYDKKVRIDLMKKLGVTNKMGVPKIVKVVVNQGIGSTLKNKEHLSLAKQLLAQICGQTPSVREARVSVASFGLRRGMPVGLKVTLRGNRMYDFLDRLFSIVLPRLRDFRGVSKESFDKNGNYSLGIEDLSVFPEIDASKAPVKGLEITIVIENADKKKSEKLLELLGMPFEKIQKKE